ncbi:MAG: WD40/YVTN/BNR-like repeat-containing protein [Imperialibacter sp.]|uniref:WD40/YVTN/BNR-like repeat-containing protein n=1 Tax=Imperialibacter sp. TaxID=2038411 RepID=UPI003A89726F
MNFMLLTLLYGLLHFFAGDQPSAYSPSAETKMVEPTKEAEATNIILQSKDGGQTWQDISHGLPELEERIGFFAGESEVYLSTNGVLYRSKTHLKTPVWEKENVPELKSTSITFNQSGVMAYSNDGHIYQKKPLSDTWSPIYTSLITHSVATIFETSDGTVFMGTGKSLSKSTDKAQSWKPVQKGWVDNIVESEGVLLATGQQGIMRSTDNGDTWEWVISEGGVGIAVERVDGGFAAIAYNARTQSRRIHTSFDGGKAWQAIDEGLQPSKNISSVKQLGNYLFVGHPDGIFRSSDMGNTWQRVHAGFGNPLYASLKFALWTPAAPVEKVFKLYVSGNVLYAVAVSPGC